MQASEYKEFMPNHTLSIKRYISQKCFGVVIYIEVTLSLYKKNPIFDKEYLTSNIYLDKYNF